MYDPIKGTWQRARFEIERLLVRGPHYRFLVVAALIGVVSLVGGLAVRSSSAETLGSDVWWAFLRLSDPGYLGDDQGLWRRIVSTTLTVLGYVLFMGAMVAILTQWLNGALSRFEMGLTPVRMTGHVAILGWTASTRAVCRNLVLSERRLGRWLQLQGVRQLRLAILAHEVGPERVYELRDALGPRYRSNQIVLRSGSPLHARHLRRVDLAHAASVVIPAVEGTSEQAEGYDAAVIKTLRLMDALDVATEDLPTCVCEVLDPRRIPLAIRAYRGPLEVVASDVLVGRLLAASARQPGVADACFELLTHGLDATLYVVDSDRAQTVAEARSRLGLAIVVGVLDPKAKHGCVVAPNEDALIDSDTGVLVVAREHPEWAQDPTTASEVEARMMTTKSPPDVVRSVLIIGWSRRVPDLLAELGRDGQRWRAVCLSRVPLKTRGSGQPAGAPEPEHLVGDPTIPSDLAAVSPGEFDRIVVLASDWVKSPEEADARAVTTYLALEEVIAADRRWPKTVFELLSRSSEQMFDGGRVEIVVSPQLVSHALSQIVLRRELRGVIDELFGAGDSHVRFVRTGLKHPARFSELQAGLAGEPRIAIGVRRGGLGGAMILAPAEDEVVDNAAGDELVLIERGTEPTVAR